jgi:hypothetical protein
MGESDCIQERGLSDAQLNRIIASQWDFQQALSALTFLLDECDFDATYSNVQLRKFRCYETTVVVSFARPFEPSRGKTVLGLKTIGLSLSVAEKELKARLMGLRRQVIAHSDEDAMHFRGEVISPFDDLPLALPLLRFQETLYLTQEELRPLEALLRKLMQAITSSLFTLAQYQPHRLDVYKSPHPP